MDTSERPPRRARTRTMVAAGMAALGLIVVLLILGIVPRLRSGRELAAAARKVQTTPPNVYVVRPEAAAEAELSLAATTQAIQDAVIYARTSGYVSRRHVDRVGGERSGSPETKGIQERGRRHVVLLVRRLHLILRLREMDDDRDVEAIGERAAGFERVRVVRIQRVRRHSGA